MNLALQYPTNQLFKPYEFLRGNDLEKIDSCHLYALNHSSFYLDLRFKITKCFSIIQMFETQPVPYYCKLQSTYIGRLQFAVVGLCFAVKNGESKRRDQETNRITTLM